MPNRQAFSTTETVVGPTAETAVPQPSIVIRHGIIKARRHLNYADLASTTATGPRGAYEVARRQLKVVRLLEPEMCLECRFAHTADVEMEDGTSHQMVYCKRLDCDNWDVVSAETAKSIQLRDEAA